MIFDAEFNGKPNNNCWCVNHEQRWYLREPKMELHLPVLLISTAIRHFLPKVHLRVQGNHELTLDFLEIKF